MIRNSLSLICAFGVLLSAVAHAQIVGTPGGNELVIAQKGATQATVIASPKAGEWEKKASADLVKYIEMMTGAKPALADTPEAIAAALKTQAPLLVVGEEAIKARPALSAELKKALRKEPVLRGDSIVLRRDGNRLYIAGTNDEAHYYAVSQLLQMWGVRWYVPTEFGEVVPEYPELRVGQLNYSYSPPFEVRHYWNAWRGDNTGRWDFQKRNFMAATTVAGMGHALDKYTRPLAPAGKTHYNVPFAEPKTAEAVAAAIADEYAKSEGSISLAIADGVYDNDSLLDKELRANTFDKYYMGGSFTDPMMVFYNNVAKILREKHPNSKTLIGGMAYTNVTIPPQRKIKPEPNLVMWLAPIDIDPIHGMDDPNSPPRQEYRDMLHRWADLMDGRVVIYDYDQGMLIWRDVPNPSHMAFKQDVKHYQKAGILGLGTESRGATATIFLNMYFRGQLMWNPDADVDAMLAEFYPKFYGPAAAPMERYWSAIYKAWENTIVTEHEYFLFPTIYTPELVAELQGHLQAALALVKPLEGKANLSRNEKLYLERMKFTQLSYEVIDAYRDLVTAGAREANYAEAVAAGERGLAARDKLTDMSPIFTTYKVIGEKGAPWWPGEVQQYRELLKLTDGTDGTLVTKLPLEWSFRRDPNDSGLASGWAYKPVDLNYWNANKSKYSIETRKDYPTTEWETLRSDLYMQAQGVRHPDRQSYTGHAWYRTQTELTAEQAKQNLHLKFPGIFNETWLYVNGNLVAHREQKPMWWKNDYRMEWDVDLSGHLQPGANTITVRLHNPHHFGGIFRRPFIYRSVAK